MSLRNIFRINKEKTEPSNVVEPIGNTRIRIEPQAFRQLDYLQLVGSRYIRGERIGLRDSLRRKPAAYFVEHRKYVPGDDVRFVDWKASARHEHIFVKQGVHQKDITVNLLLDTSGSMTWGDPSKRNGQLSLVAALSYLALVHGDRIYIQPLGNENAQNLGPISGKGQMPNLLRYLSSLAYGGRIELEPAIQHFSHKVARGGLTYILSDFLGADDLGSALEYLPAPTWDVVVLHTLHPEEVNPEIKGDLELIDIESSETANYDITDLALQMYHERITHWQKQLDLICVDNNAFYAHIPTNWSLATEVIPFLRSINLVKPI